MKKRTLRARSGGFPSTRRDSLPARRDLTKIPERGRAYVRESIAAIARAMDDLMKKRTLRARSGRHLSMRRDLLPAQRCLQTILERGRAYVRESIASHRLRDGRAE